MKRPTLKRKVTTYTVVTWELSYDTDEAEGAEAPSGEAQPAGGAAEAGQEEPAPSENEPSTNAAPE